MNNRLPCSKVNSYIHFIILLPTAKSNYDPQGAGSRTILKKRLASIKTVMTARRFAAAQIAGIRGLWAAFACNLQDTCMGGSQELVNRLVGTEILSNVRGRGCPYLGKERLPRAGMK